MQKSQRLIILLLLVYFNLAHSDKEIHTHAIMGEYYTDWKQLGPCEKSRLGTNEFQVNTRLTKKNRSTRIIGNFTLLQTFDEDTSMHVDFMILGSNAAWVPNAYKFELKGCSSFLQFLGKSGFPSNMKMPSTCPIPKGVYIINEFDPDRFLGVKTMPKQFFYGKFKLVTEYVRQKKRIGCCFIVLDFIPKWQRSGKH